MAVANMQAGTSAGCADVPASTATDAIAMRDVTETRTMPIACQAHGPDAPHSAGGTTPSAPEQPPTRQTANKRDKLRKPQPSPA